MTSPLSSVTDGGWSPSGPHNVPYRVLQRSSPDAVAIGGTPHCCYGDPSSAQRTNRVLSSSLIQATHEDVLHATMYGQRLSNASYGAQQQQAGRSRKEYQFQQQYLDTPFPSYGCYEPLQEWNTGSSSSHCDKHVTSSFPPCSAPQQQRLPSCQQPACSMTSHSPLQTCSLGDSSGYSMYDGPDGPDSPIDTDSVTSARITSSNQLPCTSHQINEWMTSDVDFIAHDVIDDVTCQIRVLSNMTSSVAADCQPSTTTKTHVSRPKQRRHLANGFQTSHVNLSSAVSNDLSHFSDEVERLQYERAREKKDKHNCIERRRRYNINDCIQMLATLLPSNRYVPDQRVKGRRSHSTANKGSILKASVDYVKYLQVQQTRWERAERTMNELETAKRHISSRLQELEVQLLGAGCRCHSSLKSFITDLQSGVTTDDDIKSEPGSTSLETPLCPRICLH